MATQFGGGDEVASRRRDRLSHLRENRPAIAAPYVVGSGEKSMGVEERTTGIVVVADPSAVASPPAGASPLAPPILLLAKRRRLLFKDTRELRALGETLRRRSVQHHGAPDRRT
jgi:hypothetical protein